VKRLIVFDLDGTLAESNLSFDAKMSTLLHELLYIIKVAVISGGDWPQFKKQLLSILPHDEWLENLFLLHTSGTKFYNTFPAIGEKYIQKIMSYLRLMLCYPENRRIDLIDPKNHYVFKHKHKNRLNLLIENERNEIINKVKGINRVVYDISSKPPATIEWE